MSSIDVSQVLGYEFEPRTFTYSPRDACLYALGIGAGQDPLDQGDLQFVYELFSGGFKVIPTFSVNFAFGFLTKILAIPGIDFNPMMLLHGEHYFERINNLPPEATITNYAKIAKVYDKGSGAVLIIEANSMDESGNKLAINEYTIFIRGLGGFGGDRGPSSKTSLPPEREPDAIHKDTTLANQALLYRLSGDKNPLHADPEMAAMGGYERPILHGLCTFGFAARAVIRHFCNNEVEKFRSMRVRFSKHVFPGETLITEMWKVSDHRVVIKCRVDERNVDVLTNAVVKIGE
ncbi:MAG: 3-alpha,7-alpha,12-alpha-trihydroxy-5-beta-cholest-24-enoyl-CoA hydratase [Chloroflexi bacterium]|nr:3-alpha,7-alpha,12-alpha-trihydroxy-5-beta-cholest-24-enoyl-CoA hydratase [Chloroflexota bacterium]